MDAPLDPAYISLVSRTTNVGSNTNVGLNTFEHQRQGIWAFYCMASSFFQSIGNIFPFFRFGSLRSSSRQGQSPQDDMDPAACKLRAQSPACLGGYIISGVLGSGGNGVVLEGVLKDFPSRSPNSSAQGAPGNAPIGTRFAIKCSTPGDESSAAVLEVCLQHNWFD